MGRASSAEIGVPCISPIPSSSAPAAWYCCSSSIIVCSALFAGHGARAQRQLTEMRPDAGCGECDGGRTWVAGGCGLVVINNIAQINIARGGDKNLKDVFVSLISIFNCAGRLFWGLSSDFALQRWGICRPYFFGVVAAILGGVFVLLELFSGVWVLYVAAIFGGVRSRFLVFFSILKCLRRQLNKSMCVCLGSRATGR